MNTGFTLIRHDYHSIGSSPCRYRVQINVNVNNGRFQVSKDTHSLAVSKYSNITGCPLSIQIHHSPTEHKITKSGESNHSQATLQQLYSSIHRICWPQVVKNTEYICYFSFTLGIYLYYHYPYRALLQIMQCDVLTNIQATLPSKTGSSGNTYGTS